VTLDRGQCMGVTLYAGQMQQSADGSWTLLSPPLWTVVRALRVFDPKPGTMVTGIYFGEGENELAVDALDPRAFEAMTYDSSFFCWRDHRLPPRSTLRMTLTGEAEAITCVFRPIDPPKANHA